MPNIQQILKQIQKEMSCPICGAKFPGKDIRVRGAFEHTIIIETVCTMGHLTLFMTILRGRRQSVREITPDDMLNFSNILNNFNGDFEKLWKK